MATTTSQKNQSAQDESPWPVFFIPPVGFIQYVNPYAVLGIPEETLQSDIALAIEKIEGVKDEGRIEYVAAAIVSDPVRRLVWHCLRWPGTPPSAWKFLLRYRWTKIDGNIAAYLLHEVVTRELQGLRGDALVELWAQVQQEFAALLTNPRLDHELSQLAARWNIDSPMVSSEAKIALQDVVPAMHGVLMGSSKKNDLHTFHWSNVARPQGSTRLLGACLLRMRTRELEKARRTFERGDITTGLALYAKLAHGIPQTDAREKRRILFEVGEHLTEHFTRHAIPTTREQVERTIDLLRAIGSLTAFDSRLLSTIAFYHVRAAECAAYSGEIQLTVHHLLQVGLCDPDRPFELEMIEGDILQVTTTGLTWSIGPPVSLDLMKTLNHWVSAIEAGDATLPNAFVRELRELAPWIDLATRLDISLPHDQAIAAASQFLVELSARELGEPFAVTKARIMSRMPEFAEIPWKAIEALDTQGSVLFPEVVTQGLPKPPAALDLPKSIGADIKHLRNSMEALEEHASSQKSGFLGRQATFVYPWFFSELSGLVKDVATGLRHALCSVLAVVGIAGLVFFMPLSLLVLGGRGLAEAVAGVVKCLEILADAARAWFAHAPDNKSDEPVTYGLAKFQALAALAFIVVGLFYFADKFGREYLVLNQREKAYTAMCNAATTRDTTAVAKAARGFLELTPPDKFDYRTLDVLEKHSEALVREMARAARDKRQSDLDQLVAEATTVQKRTQTEKQAWKEIEAAR